MQTTTVAESLVKPVQPGEICERSDCPAEALVAVQVPSYGRYVLCGHHYDWMTALHAPFIEYHDSRYML